MASDKFGNNPVAPLYNATGRNPRDLEMGSIGKPLGSVGNSGGGGKDFGTPGKAAQLSPLGQGNRLSPFSFYGPNSLYALPDNIRNKYRTGGGGSGGGSTDADGRDSAGNDINKDHTLTQGLSAETKPVKVPRTAAQKQATAATRAEKKTANPAYGTKNQNRPIKGESPIARRRSAPSAPKSVTNEQSIGNLKQKSMGNF